MTQNTLPVRAFAEFSDKGKRAIQEDFFLGLKEKGIFVVADGFGGPVAGVEASKLACESVRNYLVKEAGDREATMPFVLRSYFSLAGNVLFNALLHANFKLCLSNRNKDVNEKGGASILAAFQDGDLLALANVGACSAWLFRDGEATELVVPRTYARMVEPFLTQAPAALQIPLMAVGMTDDLEPEIVEVRLKPRDWVLFQTDGLSREAVYFLQELQRRGFEQGKVIDAVQDFFSTAKYEENATGQLIFY